MKHYKIKDKQLNITDSSRGVLIMPYIALALTTLGMSLQLINRSPLEFDSVTILYSLLLLASIVVFIWAYVKKSFKNELSIDNIAALKLSRFNRSVFYIVLYNGKQRDLSEVRESIRATKLLMKLREKNSSITGNFTENEIATR